MGSFSFLGKFFEFEKNTAMICHRWPTILGHKPVQCKGYAN